MYYSININQLAIATHNETYNTNIDLIDGVILEYLQKQSISTFAKKNYIIHQGEIYYRICYDNIITQLPLLNITSKEVIGRRLKKMAEYGIIQKYIDRKNMNKTYFTTTELFETFFTYLPTQKSTPPDSKVVSLPTQKSNHIIDNNINDNNINDKKKDASAFSSQGSYSEIPNNSTGAKNAQPQKQMDKDFEEFWEEFGNKVKRKDAVAKYKVATSKATHAEIMAGVRRYKEYLKIATWLQIQTPCVWLNAERWNDNFDELTKQECIKQGKPLPIAQKTPEKQQEEVKMKEDTQRKRESVIQGLKAEEVEFMEHIKQVLKTNFDARFHKDWIDNLIFSLRNKVAYFGFTEQKHINAVQYNLEKFKGHVMRELSTFKDFEVEKIELKLINF